MYTTIEINNVTLNQALANWIADPTTAAVNLDAVEEVAAYNPNCPNIPVADAVVTLRLSTAFLAIPVSVILLALAAYGWCVWDNATKRRKAKAIKATRRAGPKLTSAFDVPKSPVEIESKDLIFRVKGKKWSLQPKKRNGATLLKYCSGFVKPGKVTFLMGPSGAVSCVLRWSTPSMRALIGGCL